MFRETFVRVIIISASAARAENQQHLADNEWEFIYSSKAP
jgi:hypothetical protein